MKRASTISHVTATLTVAAACGVAMLPIACGGDGSETTAPAASEEATTPAGGPKADEVATAEKKDTFCKVVLIQNGDVMKESLASIYDIDSSGEVLAEESATAVEIIQTDAGSAEARFRAVIGMVDFSDAGDTVSRIDEQLGLAQKVESWRVQKANAADYYTVRIFPDIGLGVVLYKGEATEQTELAVVDCRDLPMPAYWLDSTPEPEEMKPVEELRCVVADGYHETLEEQIGSAFDIDDEGYFQADSDSVDVSLYKSDLSMLPSGLLANVGQMSFGLHSADDKIEPIQEANAGGRYGFQSYRLQYAEFPEEYTYVLRVFLPVLSGMVFHQNADGSLDHVATLDCSGRPAPVRPR